MISMKKQFFAITLVLALLLCGCGLESPSISDHLPTEAPTTLATDPDIPETTEASIPETTEAPAPQINVFFEYKTSDSQEYATLTGFDPDGNAVWSWDTDRYEMAQLERVSDIGQWQDRYYYVEDCAVVAVDAASGEILWRNGDFGGCPAGLDASLIDEDGTLYLCGFFGPDFFAVDADGNTLKQIDSFDEDYYWAYKLTKDGSIITVHLSGGPEGDVGDPGYTFTVEME